MNAPNLDWRTVDELTDQEIDDRFWSLVAQAHEAKSATGDDAPEDGCVDAATCAGAALVHFVLRSVEVRRGRKL